MRKLQLRIAELEVESFATATREAPTGTVRGFDSTTGNQIICGCTDGGDPCDTQFCSGLNCSNGCGTNTCPPNTRDVTCATGNQIICEC